MYPKIRALFSSKIFYKMDTVAFSFVFDKYYSIMDTVIGQFICKSRDESFKPSYSMIEQCLSNKNESATVSFSKSFLNWTRP